MCARPQTLRTWGRALRSPRVRSGGDALRFHGGDFFDLRRRCRGRVDPVKLANDVRDEVALVLGLRLLDQLAHPLSSLLLVDALPNEDHHVGIRRPLMEDVLAADAEPAEHLPVRARALPRVDAVAELTPLPRLRDREDLHGKCVHIHETPTSLHWLENPDGFSRCTKPSVAVGKGASEPR